MGKELTTPIIYTIDSNAATPRNKKAPDFSEALTRRLHYVDALVRTLLAGGSPWELTQINIINTKKPPLPSNRDGFNACQSGN